MSKSVLSGPEADSIAVNYSPRKFPTVISPTATEFVAFNSAVGGPSFRIDRIVAEQAGVAELERVSLEEKVEREALTRLKDLQESAYQEAYQLGIDEGREKAFSEVSEELRQKLEHFEGLITRIENLKKDLTMVNETQIVQLTFYMAKRLVLSELSTQPEVVVDVVRQAIESAQTDEKITVQLSPSDFAFIETAKAKTGKEFEFLKNTKLETNERISSGGCLIETNYGDVDATLEQRLEKLWQALAEKLPKVKNVVGD